MATTEETQPAPRPARCPHCNGTGTVMAHGYSSDGYDRYGHLARCGVCKGFGVVRPEAR
jgi:hypothetical protein